MRVDFAPLQTGDVDDALIIATAEEPDPDPRPWIAVHADPDTARRAIVLHGVETSPDALVAPRVVALGFSPATTGEARCGLVIATDDPSAPLRRVRLFANRDTDAGNVAPFVAIHAPLAGAQHQGAGPIAPDVTVSDPDQPASTLTCRIRSAYQARKRRDRGVHAHRRGAVHRRRAARGALPGARRARSTGH